MAVRTRGGGIGSTSKGHLEPSRSDQHQRLEPSASPTLDEALFVFVRTPKLCVTVTADTTAELRERRDRIRDADLVELRVDTVRDPSASGALAGRRTPVIFTCRPTWEGGRFTGSEEERKRLLREAVKLGADYVDIEWKADFDDVIQERGGRGIVLSTHDFDGVPDDLQARMTAMRSTGAEVVKLAITARCLTDCLALLRLKRPASASPCVLLAMGDAGIATRVLAGHFGSCWTYASDTTETGKHATETRKHGEPLINRLAPGQIDAARMLEEFSFRSIADRTAIYGVVGKPVMHSISPAMHNAAFRAMRFDAVYLPLAAVDFSDFLTFAEHMQVRGASVTTPFKVAAFEYAEEADAVSRRVHAANTLKKSDDRWLACNTDVAGLLAPLAPVMPVQGVRATVMGAGGAGRAAIEALQSAGAIVTVSARRREATEDAAAATGAAVGSWPPAPHSWDVLVNATTVGLANADESPLPGGPFTGKLVYDLIYNPPLTRLLRDAEAAGCQTLGGLEMLVAQAQRQFEWWTGACPSERVMRDAAVAALSKPGPSINP